MLPDPRADHPRSERCGQAEIGRADVSVNSSSKVFTSRSAVAPNRNGRNFDQGRLPRPPSPETADLIRIRSGRRPRNLAFPPFGLNLVTTTAPRSALRPVTTTVAPNSASAMAVALPIPDVEPVTRAVLPSSSFRTAVMVSPSELNDLSDLDVVGVTKCDDVGTATVTGSVVGLDERDLHSHLARQQPPCPIPASKPSEIEADFRMRPNTGPPRHRVASSMSQLQLPFAQEASRTGRGRTWRGMGAGMVRPRSAARPGRCLPRVGCSPGRLAPAEDAHGAPFSTLAVCLGWHWYPYRYSRTCDDDDGAPVKEFPSLLEGWAPRLAPPRVSTVPYDAAIVNLYEPGAKLGLHQDRIEGAEVIRAGSPVVTISLGDTCVFRFGNTSAPTAHTKTWAWPAAISSSSVDHRDSRTTEYPKSMAVLLLRISDKRSHQRHAAPDR